MSGFEINCGHCGHKGEFDTFTRTTIGGDLPKGQYQCPECGAAWKVQGSEFRVLRSGSDSMIIPGRVEVVPVQGRL